MIRALASLLLASAALAQDAPVAFEVASVKPSARDQMRDRFGAVFPGGMRGGPGTSDPGQIAFVNASLNTLIVNAYGVKPYQVSGPEWLAALGFNVIAKVPAGATKEQVKLMLQNLLAERFKLALHHEKRDLPVYTLEVGKNGPKMKLCQDPEAGGTIGPWNGNVRMVVPWTMETLADYLSPRLDRPVLNNTGLTERYDFTLYWAADNYDAGHTDAAEPAPTIFAAVQELGLKMVRSTAPMDILAIDHAEKNPAEN